MGKKVVRRFEFNDDKSAKFWEIEQAGAKFVVRYGKIGTAGQSQDKEFDDAAAAAKAADKLIAEKTGKGYAEVGSGTPTSSAKTKAVAATVKTAKTSVSTEAPKTKRIVMNYQKESYLTESTLVFTVTDFSLETICKRAKESVRQMDGRGINFTVISIETKES